MAVFRVKCPDLSKEVLLAVVRIDVQILMNAVLLICAAWVVPLVQIRVVPIHVLALLDTHLAIHLVAAIQLLASVYLVQLLIRSADKEHRVRVKVHHLILALQYQVTRLRYLRQVPVMDVLALSSVLTLMNVLFRMSVEVAVHAVTQLVVTHVRVTLDIL